MLEDHGGHGIGRTMHAPPHVANFGIPGQGLDLRPGLVIALEPMLQAGGRGDYRHLPDGWGVATADRSRAAHFEHTVAITADGPRVLTVPSRLSGVARPDVPSGVGHSWLPLRNRDYRAGMDDESGAGVPPAPRRPGARPGFRPPAPIPPADVP